MGVRVRCAGWESDRPGVATQRLTKMRLDRLRTTVNMPPMPHDTDTAARPDTARPDAGAASDRSFARATGQLAVDRAIAELRRGGVVAVRAGANLDRLSVVTAAEMITEDSLSQLRRIAGSAPMLGLSRNRAAALGSATDAPAVSITIDPTRSVADILSLADPTTTPRNAPITALPERAESATAAAISLVKLARLLPSVVIATVPGLRPADMAAWAQGRTLLLVDAPDIDSHAETSARRLVRAASASVPLADAEDAQLIAFRPLDGGTEHVVIQIGKPDPTEPVLVRLHSACLTGDLLGSLRCDCGDQLRGAIAEIAAAGGGLVLYLAQEGRDIGLINKLRAYSLQDLGVDTVDANTMLGFEDDERVYYPAAEILRQLGIGRIRLMTNNPSKIEQIARCGVEVVDRVPHVFESNQHNERYLQTKAQRSGHMI